MKYVTSLAATLSFIVMLGGPAGAKSVWDQLA